MKIEERGWGGEGYVIIGSFGALLKIGLTKMAHWKFGRWECMCDVQKGTF